MFTSPLAEAGPIDTVPMSDSLRALARRGVVRRYRKGTLLIAEGDRGDTLYIILAGRLRAYAANLDNEREVTYGIYLPGEYVGEMGLDGGPRAANVVTLEASTVAVVTRPTLEAHLQEDPAFAFELLNKVIRRARAATMGLRQIALNDVYGRVKALLEDLADAQGDGTALIRERLTHKDIAQRLGCTREMISRVMKSLVDGRYVEPAKEGLCLRRALPPRW
jgi:CRP/FNR family transcriptional regulator, cyclic AMP receptor protein